MAISKKLAAELQKIPGVTTTLTRSDDRYVTLDDRNAIANKRGADLFISLHANAAENREAHGIQTYYLNNATDKASKRLADRENKAFGKQVSTVQSIVSNMIQNANTDYSRDLATQVQSAMVTRLSQKYNHIQDQHVRTALFYVLVGSKAPSILVETAFVSNPHEERRLVNPAYQQHVAEAIAAGVVAYRAETAKAKRNL